MVRYISGLISFNVSYQPKDVIEYLRQPVDMASLVAFRWGFGIILLRYVMVHEEKDWILEFFVRPSFNFSYFGFGWVKPLHVDWMYLILVGLGAASVGIMLGVFYRVSVLTYFLGLLYFVLCEPAYFQNHVFFILSLLVVLFFLPLHQSNSLAVGLFGTQRREFFPRWGVLVLGFLVAIVYVFGAIAKIGPDWFQCQPLWTSFRTRVDFPFVGGWFDAPFLMFLFAYGVIIFEVLVVPGILWKPTRYWVFGTTVVFHAMNKMLWTIDVFPWLAILSTTLLLPVSWPREAGLMRTEPIYTENERKKEPSGYDGWISEKTVLMFLGLFCLLQVTLPLRHIVYEGWVGWNAWGRRVSWRMRLDAKKPLKVHFTIMSKQSTKSWEPKPENYLSRHQYHRMARNPELIRQFSHFLADRYREKAGGPVAVYADVRTTYNTRPPQRIVDSTVDLSQQSYSWTVPDWVRPLEKPLPDERNCLKVLGWI